MTYNEFFDKYGFADLDINPAELAGWLQVMGACCSLPRQEFLAIMADFYNNAADIYQSLNEAATKLVNKMIDEGAIQFEDSPSDEDKPVYKA